MPEVEITMVVYKERPTTIKRVTFVTEDVLRSQVGFSPEEFVQRFGKNRQVVRDGVKMWGVSAVEWNVTLKKQIAVKVHVQAIAPAGHCVDGPLGHCPAVATPANVFPTGVLKVGYANLGHVS